MRQRGDIALLLTTAALMAGCGYNLVGRASTLPDDIQKIYVEPLVNETQRPQVDQILTQAIADELVTRRRLKVQNSAAAADMRFERPPRPGENEGEVVWANARYLFREDYPLEDDDAAYFDRENLAIEETSVRFPETLVTDLLEGF